MQSIVLEAKNLKKVNIVLFDWLEDSLLAKSKRPINEARYLLENILKAEKIQEKGKRKADQLQNQSKRPKGVWFCSARVLYSYIFLKQSTHSLSTRTVPPRVCLCISLFVSTSELDI
jgi:hypothetical protein